MHRSRTLGATSLALLFLLPLIAFGTRAHAGTLTVQWTAPTTCAGGEALTECPTTGFEVSEASSQQGSYAVKETTAAGVTSRSYAVAAGQTRCYYVKTVSNAQLSAESTRACATVPFLPPKAPSGIQVTVTVQVSAP